MPYQHPAGCDVNEDMHAVIPFLGGVFEDVTSRILVYSETIVDQEDYLHDKAVSLTTHRLDVSSDVVA